MDARGDLYALGATLYHLLTGIPPISVLEQMAGVALMPAETLRPHITDACARILRRALQLGPDQRYRDAATMHAAVAQVLDPNLRRRDDAARSLHRYLSAHMPNAILDTRVIPSQQPMYGTPEPPLPPALQQALDGDRLYRHQAEAVMRVRQGDDIVVVTGTASGKSRCYNLPILEHFLHDHRGTALYLFPIKALINDQTHSLRRLVRRVGAPISVSALHGDLSQSERRAARQTPPRIALSNPEFVHWMLARHLDWRQYFARLRFIVLDEVHTYRGAFGSHVAQLLRRLLRVCAHYDPDGNPQIICCSATIGNPADFVERLIGRQPYVIDRDGAARTRRHVVFWQPIEVGTDVRRSASDDAVQVTVRAVQQGQQVITFGRARPEIEQMLVDTRSSGDSHFQHPKEGYAAYRGGYNRTEREHIEGRLRDGSLSAVFATSALEMGIDIGSLQVSVLTGFPGSRMSFWQQAGRAGRREEDAHTILIGAPNPLDHYFLTHPDDLLCGPAEEATIDLDNPHIVVPHLMCAAREWPLQQREIARVRRELPAIGAQIERLIIDGTLQQQVGVDGQAEYVYAPPELPHRRINMRSATQDTYAIMCQGIAEPLGTIEPPQLYREAHERAIYYHQGVAYRVQRLDPVAKEVHVVPETTFHMTVPIGRVEVSSIDACEARLLQASDVSVPYALGNIRVSETILGFREFKGNRRSMVRTENLPKPYAHIYDTVGFWLEVPHMLAQEIDGLVLPAAGDVDSLFHAAAHGLEHLLQGLVPSLALCDRRDLGSHYILDPAGHSANQIFVFDSFPGGLGLAERGYHHLHALLARAYDTVSTCQCVSGCPYCVQAGWCRENNFALDKAATLYLLGRVLNRPTMFSPSGISP